MIKDILEQLAPLDAQIAALKGSGSDMEASLTEDLEADSLDAVELNMALEDACGVSVPDEELAKLKTVGDIYNYITAHI